jgi:2-polyprenyl-3-methyl-5-hydroxy-6-metoxy-1,4-benzoquinol methylase
LSVQRENQWNDFLLRKVDPYASAKYQILLEGIGPVNGLSALVVGSGSGEFAALLAQGGASVTAIDVDQATIDFTLRTARDFGVSVQGIVSKLEDFQTTQTFDLVAATDVIEHLPDDRAAFRKLQGLCRAKGRIIITVPALPFLFGYHDEAYGHYRRYTRASLRAAVPQTLTIQFLRYYGFLLIPVALLYSRILRKHYPVAPVGRIGSRSSLGSLLIRLFFRWEKHFPPPAGTSLLLLALAP